MEDLLDSPSGTPIIAEGFRLLPALVKPIAAADRAVWLLPTPEFRRAAFASRRPFGAPWSFVIETSDPGKALANLLERDQRFTDQLRDDTRRLGLRVIDIGPDITANDTADLVTAALGL